MKHINDPTIQQYGLASANSSENCSREGFASSSRAPARLSLSNQSIGQSIQSNGTVPSLCQCVCVRVCALLKFCAPRSIPQRALHKSQRTFIMTSPIRLCSARGKTKETGAHSGQNRRGIYFETNLTRVSSVYVQQGFRAFQAIQKQRRGFRSPRT